MTKDTKSEIVVILGTRPEIIKLAPVIRRCEEQNISFSLIHTGQHYSEELDSIFFDQLSLPEPDYNLEVGSQPHGKQTGEMLAGIEEILQKINPKVVLVQGDTNSVLAGALATSKMDLQLGHVEAGLRSFDRNMPEETNRVLTDHVADYLFAPTEETAKLLYREGIQEERIFITGNTIVDAVYEHSEIAVQRSKILTELDLKSTPYALVTAHRAENVDNPERFKKLLSGIESVAHQFGLEIVYPIHPRAKNRCEEYDIEVPTSIQCIEPLDYLDFLRLEQEADIILTDSGGVQEEACILGVPCVTVRENTERPETVDVGANQLSGVEPESILTSATEMLKNETDWNNPFGDGTAAGRIIDISMGK
ncbi:non-hydrolyzing UDP-N-acetylglucosamine 2-epimerase [Haladaptatus sp. GCM10025707]|uniref:non-hydrolyzing UDP-N-acetylglucosamine 2-epimerase n=1 Tax=unclassified Haladaptatus TaxID=2622732 RepID=UPI0023E770EB|nr:UDP-N-acetylglucosamine 2-epimerase (non-hydrolyzing) [Haladaptatus sp. QDMS2]